VVEEGNTYPVGFNGLVYLPQLSPTSKLAASWPGGQCTASLAPKTGDALDDHPIRLECR
jgi:outer membrane usher protein FimD/PapC